jgi:hypothetical protein
LQLLPDIPVLSPGARPVLVTASHRAQLLSATTRGIPYLRKPINFNELLGILGDNSLVH